ncbi:HAD family hydrolase [Streptomyces sp. CG1]|uniref:HAD family hydrolase n=1 Tax=Streptomyces sp. CG1 TaxID=1287523 RepID=UPI0034E2CBB3
MIRAILCDIDGVLIRGQSFKDVLERDHGIDTAVTATFFDTVFADCQLGTADLRTELAAVLPAWGWTSSVDDYLRQWFAAESNADQELLTLIGRYRGAGLGCYLATMQEPRRADFMLRELGLADHFDGAFVSHAIGHAKSSPAFFHTVLDQLPDLRPHELVLIDDQHANVLSAREAGLHGIEFTTVARLRRSVEALIADQSYAKGARR